MGPEEVTEGPQKAYQPEEAEVAFVLVEHDVYYLLSVGHLYSFAVVEAVAEVIHDVRPEMTEEGYAGHKEVSWEEVGNCEGLLEEKNLEVPHSSSLDCVLADGRICHEVGDLL